MAYRKRVTKLLGSTVAKTLSVYNSEIYFISVYVRRIVAFPRRDSKKQAAGFQRKNHYYYPMK